MSETKPRSFSDRYALGLFFATVGAICLFAIKTHTSRSLTNPNDPGPWLMPALLASLLLLGGIAFILSNIARSRTHPVTDVPSNTCINWQPWMLLGGVVVYLLLLPWIGFLTATPAFVFAMLWRSKILWWKAAIAAVILTVVGQFAFVWGFNTPLPTGFWN